ncbi:NADP-binding protein [Gigaspora margarita]|uniref:NADP-binding protein n=1 Tax=Gigaspora margarita TaxID=4874 RepID=A0A8H3XG02_GIGMA|nr:NADP-binding protein [Gigaspora margarita]
MFTLRDIPDLNGKVAIVTGGNCGIGYVTARELALHQAHVFIASRNEESANSAIERIKNETKNNNVEFLHLDLVDLKSVKLSAENFLNRGLPLHILINNAAIMATPWALTQDGIQDQFGVNYVGHFLFTKILLPKLEESAPSRIVNVSCEAHKAARNGIEFDKLEDETAQTSWYRYAQSKLANILFTKALAKKCEEKNVYVNCIHPGFVKTDLSRAMRENYTFVGVLLLKIGYLFALSPEYGAITQLYCATSPEIEEKNYRGLYFIPYGKVGEPFPKAEDQTLIDNLWTYTENLIKKSLVD